VSRKSQETENPSFPYLENKLAEYLDTHTVSTTVLRMAKVLKTIGKTEIGTSYYQILTVKVCPER